MSTPESIGIAPIERSNMLLTVAVISAVCVCVLLVYNIGRALITSFAIAKRLRTVPRAPGSLPVLGHILVLLGGKKAPWDVMRDWVTELGNIYRWRIFHQHYVVVAGPQAMKRIFQTNMRQYCKDLGVSYGPFLPILGTGLVTANGELWQRQRVLLGPALRVEILDAIVRIAKDAVDRLTSKLESLRGTGTAIDMEEAFRILTLQVIAEAILSLPPEKSDEVFPHVYLPVMEEAHRRVLRRWRQYLPTPEWFKFNARVNRLNSFIKATLRQRWQQRRSSKAASKGDILDRIMGALEERGEQWNATVEDQLCYEIKTFILAGHETSAAMLSFSLLELCRQPQMLARVHAEADKVFGPKDTLPSKHAVEGMEYTLAVLKESLRKYSVVPVVSRVLACDSELEGYTVPAGTRIICQLGATHNMYKDPQRFEPDRFMPGGEYDNFDDADRPYMFLPFIQGPRNCLGQHLALLEGRVVLALLLERFRFKPVAENIRLKNIIPVSAEGGMHFYIN